MRLSQPPKAYSPIANCAFAGCTTVTSITLPKSLEKIGDYAFVGCERLTDIVLPDSINKIGDNAFLGCTALENVTFPNNIVEMGSGIFYVDYGNEPVPWLKKKQAENSLVIINDNLIDGSTCTGDVVIPDNVESIAAYAFLGAKITGAQLPDGMTQIPDGLFNACNSLTSINIPDGVTKIGYNAFRSTKLKSITIPNSVTKIGEYAFYYSGLTSITIPGSVTEIGDGAFSHCLDLKNVTLSEGLKKIGSGTYAGWSDNDVFGGTGITELTLPDSVESIEEYAFYGCSFDITYKGEIYFPELYNELHAEINGQ